MDQLDLDDIEKIVVYSEDAKYEFKTKTSFIKFFNLLTNAPNSVSSSSQYATLGINYSYNESDNPMTLAKKLAAQSGLTFE